MNSDVKGAEFKLEAERSKTFTAFAILLDSSDALRYCFRLSVLLPAGQEVFSSLTID